MTIPSAQRLDGKPGRELALWAEGFFRLEFLLLLFQDKRSSPRGNERARIIYLNEYISAEERSTCKSGIATLRSQ